MKISRFMSEALFNLSSGYYRTKNPIGKDSDFITAPEISQVFGELIAAYIVQISSVKKSAIALVEMGAGKGTLFKDILSSIRALAAKKIPQALDFIEQTTFHIIEINPVLQKIQQENLGGFEIRWYENFADFAAQNQNREIVFISNELFDCFPIDQFINTNEGWRERMVGEKNFILADFDQKINDFVKSEVGVEAPIGAVFEYSLEARNFMTQLCKSLKRQGGVGIIIDYGYVKNEFANTFQAVKNHQKCNVLESVGNADLTALVDFLALEKISKNCELNSSLVSQGQLLISLGIEERRKSLLAKKSMEEQKEINLAIDRLIDSNQMGELFKCLIIWS